MASDFYCWYLNFGQESACSWYRIKVPFNELRAQGFVHCFEDDNQNVTPMQSTTAMLHSDIAYFYAVIGEDMLHRMRSIKRMKAGHRKDGTPEGVDIFPPALIYDCDDNTDFVHPFNQTFAFHGVRGYPDAHLLKPGEGIDIRDAEGNEIKTRTGETVGWVDKETVLNGITFDVERNLHNMMLRHQIMREVHGCTCASPMLAKYIKEVVGQPNVYVFPNTIDPKHYSPICAVRTDKRVRILWQGGQSHLIDWYPLRNAIKAICEKYKDKVTFVLYGEYFDWIHDVIPPSMLEMHSWDAYPAYRLKRGLLNVDINLCPLANNVFNACKSAIKWYEAHIALDRVEATLAQRGPVFSEIEDGVSGLMFSTPEEFVEKLSLLIEQPELRQRLHEGAHKWIMENRTPERTIPGLFDYFVEIRSRQKREMGKPIIQTATLSQIKALTTPLKR